MAMHPALADLGSGWGDRAPPWGGSEPPQCQSRVQMLQTDVLSTRALLVWGRGWGVTMTDLKEKTGSYVGKT